MNNFEKQQLLNHRLQQLFSVFGAFQNAWDNRRAYSEQRRPDQWANPITPVVRIPRVTEANIGGLLGHYLDPDKIGPQ
jgi:hypothetical protein